MGQVKIKKISVSGVTPSQKGDFLEKEELKNLFLRDSDKPINVFYFNNGYGKTTLYNMIKQTFRLEKLDNPPECIKEIEVTLQINEDVFVLRNNGLSLVITNSDGVIVLDSDFEKILEERVLNKDVALIIPREDGEKDKTSLRSLLRFSFFSDTDYKSRKLCECDLVNTRFDGKAKSILLHYVLGENFKESEKDVFSTTNIYAKKMKFIDEHKKEVKSIEEKNKFKNSLFASVGNDYFDGLQEYDQLKINVLDIETALGKLNTLKQDALNFQFNTDHIVVKLIDLEIARLSEYKLEVQKNQELKEINVEKLKSDYQSLNIINDIDIFKIEKEIERNQEWIEKNQKKVDDYFSEKKSSIDLLNNIILNLIPSTFKKENIYFNPDILSIEITGGAKKGDGNLKTIRFLALVGLIIYKNLYPTARMLDIGFFDGMFYGVDMSNQISALTKLIEEIKKEGGPKNLQLFIFMTKDTLSSGNKDDIENFINDNQDIIYTHQYENKNYLFE